MPRSKYALPVQSCQANSRESLTPIRRCSGESTRNRPPNDQKAWPPRFDSASWSSSSTRRPALASSAVAASPVPFDASRPHVARVYDYLLGGKDNFSADRVIGDRMLASIPAVQLGVRAQRDVLGRVVRYLVGE